MYPPTTPSLAPSVSTLPIVNMALPSRVVVSEKLPDSKLLCPGCGSIMDMESVGDIEIDVCLQCNGVWLDSDELEQLKSLDSKDIEQLSPEKLAELYDANKSVPTSGILSWLFGR